MHTCQAFQAITAGMKVSVSATSKEFGISLKKEWAAGGLLLVGNCSKVKYRLNKYANKTHIIAGPPIIRACTYPGYCK